MSHWLLLLLTIVLTAAANLLLKYAALKRQDWAQARGIAANVLDLFATPSLLLGIFCLGLAVISYAVALRNINLSVAYPVMTATVVVLVTLFSGIFFGEPVTLVKAVGAVVVISGVTLLAL